MAGTSAQIWEYTGGQALNALVGLIFAFAFSAFVYAFYLSSYSIKQRLFVFSVAVLFPLFAEVSQTMHRGEESQKVSSEASPEFLAAQKALAAMMGANPAAGNAGGLAAAAGEKAKHEAELKACSRYESATRREKCQRYEMGKIAEADGKVQGYTASGNAALTAHQGNLTSMIGTIKELGNNQDHAHSMVKLFMEMGVSLLVASLIMAVLIIGSIETALAWLGEHVKNYQKAMRARGLEIGNQKKAVVKAYRPESSPTLSNESAPLEADHEMKARREAEALAAGKLPSSAGNFKNWLDEKEAKAPLAAFAPMADSAKQGVSEFAQKIEDGSKKAAENWAVDWGRADFANKQVLADAGRIGGKIGAKLDDALNAANRKNHPQKIQFPVGEGKTADDYDLIPRTDKTPALSGENTIAYLTPRLSVADTVKQIQASVKASGATSPDAIQAAVFDAFAGMTNPAPLSDSILERIAGKMAEKAIPTASPSVPFRQQSGATGIHNPVLGTEEEHFPLPLPPVDSVDYSRVPTPSRVLNSVDVHENQDTRYTQDTERYTENEKAEMMEKMAILEQELATQKAEIEAQAERDLADRTRAEANAQAKLAEAEAARNRAEQERVLAEKTRIEKAEAEARTREAEIRTRAAEAAEQAARDLAAAEAAAAEKAERGTLTDEQIELATAVIRTAIVEGHIQKVGTPQVSPILKAAGLPSGTPVLKALHKFACKSLEAEGLVIQNPNKANGQPLYLIA